MLKERWRLIACASLLCCMGCVDGIATVAVSVGMPEPPRHWLAAFPDLHFLVRFTGPQGVPVELQSSGNSLCLILPKTINAPVLVVPVARGVELPPAGCLYPWSLIGDGGGETLGASWKDGCAALILFRLQAAGFDVAALNGKRLQEELRELDDPWRVDALRVEEAALSGSLSSALLCPAASRPVRLAPGAGTWFLESPFAEAFRVEPGEILSLGALSLGYHRLFESGGGAPVGIQVGADGVTVFPTGSPGR